MELQDLDRVAQEINEYENYMTYDEYRSYQAEYNTWLDEQWAIEEERRGYNW